MKRIVIKAFFYFERLNRKVIKHLKRREVQPFFNFPDSCQIPNLSAIYELFFGHTPGFLVEIGAYDGITYSNTSGLLEAGWAGLLVEPVPEFYNLSVKRYYNYKRVELANRGISGTSGVMRMNLSGPLTSGSTQIQERYLNLSWAKKYLTPTKIEVPVETLTKTFEEFQVPENLDLLVVDVEGLETEVISSLNWDKYHPRMVIIELEDFHPDFLDLRDINRNLAQKILSFGYEIVYKDYINTVFIAVSHLDSLRTLDQN